MTDSELLLIDAQFWFDGSDSIKWIQSERIDAIYNEYGVPLSGIGDHHRWSARSWFALFVREALK